MITLDKDTHTYTDNAGNIIPGVTTILKPLYNFDHIDPGILKAAADFGQNVHLATELSDRGELDYDALDPSLGPYLHWWQQFILDTGFEIEGIEETIHSEKWGYAGTLDRRGLLYNKKAIIDIKSTARISPVNGPQLSAYSEGCLWSDKKAFAKRYTVLLSPKGYKLEEHNSRNDWNVFLACLSIFNWRKNSYGK